MEVRRRREWKRNRKEIDGEIKKTSIPAKAGISAATAAFADRRPLQCSASRKILAVARMRFRLSPEWKKGGMEEKGNGRKGEWKKRGMRK